MGVWCLSKHAKEVREQTAQGDLTWAEGTAV